MKTDDDEIFKVMRDIIRWFTSKNPAWFKTCLEPFGIAAGSIASIATLCMTVVIYLQYAEMQAAKQLDERPWVTTIKIDESSTPGTNSIHYFILHFTNTGRTPATHVSASFSQYMGASFEINQTNRLASHPDSQVMMLAPGESSQVDTLNAPLIDTLLGDVYSGKKNFYVFGRITYDDIFGIHHWTSFCQLADLNRHIIYSVTDFNDCDKAP